MGDVKKKTKNKKDKKSFNEPPVNKSSDSEDYESIKIKKKEKKHKKDKHKTDHTSSKVHISSKKASGTNKSFDLNSLFATAKKNAEIDPEERIRELKRKQEEKTRLEFEEKEKIRKR